MAENGRQKCCLALTGFAFYASNSAFCLAQDSVQEASWRVRIMELSIRPVEVKSDIPSIGGEVTTPAKFVPGANFSYFINSNWAIEFQGGNFERTYCVQGSRVGSFPVGKVSSRVLGVALQYHFLPSESLSPYIGGGLNYAWGSKMKSARGIPNIDVKNVTSTTFLVGSDYVLSSKWMLSSSLQYIVTPKYHFTSPEFESAVKLNTIIAGVGLGYRF